MLSLLLLLMAVQVPVPAQEAAVQVDFDQSYADGTEQAVITAYAADGTPVWTRNTASYPAAQLSQCCDVGVYNGKYYYVEGGDLYALALEDGSPIWVNTEFGGSSAHHFMDADGTLYLCGYYGPDLFVVDWDGKTLGRINKCRDDYNWPYEIEVNGDVIRIHYEQNGLYLELSKADVLQQAASEGGILSPTGIRASSELEPYYSSQPPYPLYTYYASYIDDNDLSTAWNEGVEGSGVGEYLELDFPAGTVLAGGVIYSGFYDTEELFYQNNAPTRLEVSSGGAAAVVEIGEYARTWQAGFPGYAFSLEKEIVSDGCVRVTVLDVRKGNKYDDTCISELHFTDQAPAENAPQNSSSTPADPAGNDAGTQTDQGDTNAPAGGAQPLSEDACRAVFTGQHTDPVLYFLYDDYAYDGFGEAFVVTEQPGGLYVNVWFVDRYGQVTDMTKGRELYGYEFQDSANVRTRYMADTGTQEFYIWENCAGGSGSTSFVFGVRNGVPYEPAISGYVQSFRKEGEEYVHYASDFSQGFHDYVRQAFTFDSAAGEFY